MLPRVKEFFIKQDHVSGWGLTKPQIYYWCNTLPLVPQFPSQTNIFSALANVFYGLDFQKHVHKSTKRNQGWAQPQSDDSTPYLMVAHGQICGC